MIWIRFAFWGLVCMNAAVRDVRALLSVALVWAIIELAVASRRGRSRQARSGEGVRVSTRPFDGARD